MSAISALQLMGLCIAVQKSLPCRLGDCTLPGMTNCLSLSISENTSYARRVCIQTCTLNIASIIAFMGCLDHEPIALKLFLGMADRV